MKRGLVIGKFMPLHLGHVALIRFAAAQCDELIVSMTYTPDDPIPGPLRFEWIKEEFLLTRGVRPEISLDNFDDESVPLARRMHRWAEFLKSRFPGIDILFSSEDYGESLARGLGVAHVPFDLARKHYPVSASFIRGNPFLYWDFISRSARPYFVKRICFYGPESTGKSTLAHRMAERYHTVYVPEVSREIIDSNNFSAEDIIRIGHAQTDRVLQKTRSANKLLFCDTDLITTQIYCKHYLGEVPPVLYELEKMITYDCYFLLNTDLPWVADGLRDLGEQRSEMFEVFRSELEKRNIRFELLHGDFAAREAQVIKRMDLYFN